MRAGPRGDAGASPTVCRCWPRRPAELFSSPPTARKTDPLIERVLSYTSYVKLGTARTREVAFTFDDGADRTRRRSSGAWSGARPRDLLRHRRVGSPLPPARPGRDTLRVRWRRPPRPSMSAPLAAEQRAHIVDAGLAIHRGRCAIPAPVAPPVAPSAARHSRSCASSRCLVVLWTVDSSKLCPPAVARIAYIAISGARPGAIILMHDGGGNRNDTLALLPRMIAAPRRRGYRLVTISQLLPTSCHRGTSRPATTVTLGRVTNASQEDADPLLFPGIRTSCARGRQAVALAVASFERTSTSGASESWG